METNNYLQIIKSTPVDLSVITPEMMPQTKEQSLIILKTLPKQYYAALSPRTVNDAIQSITPPLAIVRKKYGDQSLQAVLVIILNDVIKFFNIGKTMGQDQLVQTIRLIVEDFYYLNIDDFKLCFNNAKKGKYGKIYDRIDGNVIYEWIQKYSDERVGVAYKEMYYTPRSYDEEDRSCTKKDKDFEEFRISYAIEKMNKNENKQKQS